MAETEDIPVNLNKVKLADSLAVRTGMARSVAYEAVENIFDIIASRVAQGGSVSITNFGSFSRTDKSGRLARNPQTGDRIHVPPRKAVKFAVSPRLVDFANSPDPTCATIRKNSKGASKK